MKTSSMFKTINTPLTDGSKHLLSKALLITFLGYVIMITNYKAVII
jgi:hypothetical protein